jgi:hypothetical protein
VITNRLNGSVAFVLPKALRPSHLIFPAAVGSGPTAADLTISPNGEVCPFGPGVTDFTSLDGISFAAGE